MRRRIINLLLRILNSKWLNGTPCEYGHINGIDAMSYQELVNEDKQRPGITVREVLMYIDRFKSCPVRENGFTVIKPDGEQREGTIWDVHELRLALTPKAGDSES